MDVRIPGVSEATVADLVTDIERQGFAMIPDFLGADDLARARQFVSDAIQRSGGESVWFVGPDDVERSGMNELGRSEALRRMLEQLYIRSTGQPAPEQELYQVLRCQSGQNQGKQAFQFHYDSYVVTLLIPLEIPTVGRTGDFLLLPNTRKIRNSYLRNVIDKLMIENPLIQWVLKVLTSRGVIDITRVPLIPGNAYIFWGYRSIHANDYCDPDRVRSTVLFHFANPHAGESLPGITRFRALARRVADERQPY